MKLTRRHFGATALALAASVSMASMASAADIKIALVVKSLGNGFFEAANKVAEEAFRRSQDQLPDSSSEEESDESDITFSEKEVLISK